MYSSVERTNSPRQMSRVEISPVLRAILVREWSNTNLKFTTWLILEIFSVTHLKTN